MQVLKKVSNDPSALAAELAVAQEAFNATRDSVVDRATARQQAIRDLLQNLEDEHTDLADVKHQAGL